MATPNPAHLRRVGRALDGALWLVALLVGAYSLTNVHSVAISHYVDDPQAWLLAPIVDIALFAGITADSVLARHGLHPTRWGTGLRWFCGLATWTLNVWDAAATLDAGAIVAHSVPPIVLILLAEAAPRYRHQFATLTASAAGTTGEAEGIGANAFPADRWPADWRAGEVEASAEIAAGGLKVHDDGARSENNGHRDRPTVATSVAAPAGGETAVPVPAVFATDTGTNTSRNSENGGRSDAELVRLLADVPRNPDGTVPVRRAVAALGCGTARARRLLAAEGLLRTRSTTPPTPTAAAPAPA